MNRIRATEPKDGKALYDLCCQVQLVKPGETITAEQISKRGFVMSDYVNNEEIMRAYIAALNNQDGLISLVSEREGKVIGWLLAYSRDAWLKEGGWSSGKDNVKWLDPQAENDAEQDYFLLEKILVEPNYQGTKIGTQLFAEFVSKVKSANVNNIFIEIVEQVLSGTKALNARPIGLENKASIGFVNAMGAERVAESKNPYSYDGSYLGGEGYFRDGIYLVKLNER